MGKASAQNKFNFFIPLTLEKGIDNDGKELVKIKGVASSTAEDSDGESLDPSGFDFAPLLQTGFLNWNHQAQKTSSAICGQPTSAKVINKGKEFYIEGFLYPNKEGKSVAELAETLEKYSPDRRLGFSIEGQATERDPFNPKKVKKARVTGVAITQCPKNPNTLLSIMKGEYAEPFIEEEEKKDEDTEKAMGVDIDLNPESVEHGKKKISETVGTELKKSDIYDIILDRYPQNASVKDIFTLVHTVSQKLFNMTTPTKESIQKAFELVDEAAALIKGKDSAAEEGKENQDDKTVEKSKDSEAASAGSETDENEMNKAKDTAAILYKAGMDRDSACDTMSKGGISLSIAQGAYDSVVSEMNRKKDGGDMSALNGDLIKAVQNEFNTLKDTLSKGLENQFGTEIGTLKDSLSKGLEGIATVLRSVVTTNEQLVKDNENLQKSNQELGERLTAIEKQPGAQKSIVTRQHVDRFEKSADGQENKTVPAGMEVYNITSKSDLNKLSDRVMAELDIIKSKGNENPILENVVLSIEAAGHVPENAYAHLRAMNIILQKPE